MYNIEVTIVPPPGGEFVQGWPGIPPNSGCPPAGVKGAVEVRTLKKGVSAQWVRIELRRVEVLPGGGDNNTFRYLVGPHPLTLWATGDGYNNLYSQRLPFLIEIPESAPPTVTLQNRAGIRYELVATVCLKWKLGLLQGGNTIIPGIVPVVINKHELHSLWPIYYWPEKKIVTEIDGTLVVERSQTCHGPGDRISVAATFKLNSTYRVVVLQGFELSLKELISFHGKTHGKPSLTLLTDVAETKLTVNATLHAGCTTYQTELACQVPRTQSIPTISSARHIDVTYHLSIKAILNTGMHIIKDFPVTITNWERGVSLEVIRQIKSMPSPATTFRRLPTPKVSGDDVSIAAIYNFDGTKNGPSSVYGGDNGSTMSAYTFDGTASGTTSVYGPLFGHRNSGTTFLPHDIPERPTTSPSFPATRLESFRKLQLSAQQLPPAGSHPTPGNSGTTDGGRTEAELYQEAMANVRANTNTNRLPLPQIPSSVPRLSPYLIMEDGEAPPSKQLYGAGTSKGNHGRPPPPDSPPIPYESLFPDVLPPSFEDSVFSTTNPPSISVATENEPTDAGSTANQLGDPAPCPSGTTYTTWPTAEEEKEAYELARSRVQAYSLAHSEAQKNQESPMPALALMPLSPASLSPIEEQALAEEDTDFRHFGTAGAISREPQNRSWGSSPAIGVTSTPGAPALVYLNQDPISDESCSFKFQSVGFKSNAGPGDKYEKEDDQKIKAVTTPPSPLIEEEQFDNTLRTNLDDLRISRLDGPRKQDMSLSHTFHGAHHFVVNNLVMMNVANPQNEATVMGLLLQKGNLDGFLDSSARFPPPLCNPSTRKKLRERIIEWLTDAQRSSNLLWLHGPAGAGKSAIAQTIAEQCAARNWLGAAYFFSRSNNRGDPQQIIPTLVYQLAVTYTTYKQLVTHILVEDPLILEKVLRTQFIKLIAEPLSCLRTKGPYHPILLLVDGLDECNGEDSQRELIKLIGAFASTAKGLELPFVWIITSRPEWHINSTFSGTNPRISYHKEEVPINTPEALADVANVLHNGLQNIRIKYSDAFTADIDWPTEDQLLTIRSSASGLILFVSILLKFVDDEEVGNPVSQLDICLEFLKGKLLPKQDGTLNPLYPLDMLYSGILRCIHPPMLPLVLRILSVVLFVSESLPAQTIANFLFLDQATFYGSLRRLYSVLAVPPAELAGTNPLVIINTSFGEFLQQTQRSGKLGIAKDEAYANIDQNCIRWLGMRSREEMRGGTGARDKFLAGVVPWYGTESYSDIVMFAGRRLWNLWSSAEDEDMPRIYENLRQINFANFDHISSRDEPIFSFEHNASHVTAMVLQLNSWQAKQKHHSGSSSLLRYEPGCPTDRRLRQEYTYLINHTGMKEADPDRLGLEPENWAFMCLSLESALPALRNFGEVRKTLLDPNPMYFFLGHNKNSAMVIAYRPAMDVEDLLSATFYQICITHSISVGEWPQKDHFDALVTAVNSLQPSIRSSELWPVYTIMAFVADPEHADPIGRLAWVLEVLSTQSEVPKIETALRKRILSEVPQNTQPTVARILALVMCRIITAQCDWSETILPHDISKFFFLDEDIIKRALPTVNLLLSSCPLLFSTRAVLDFYESDIATNPEEWASILAPEPRVWIDIWIQYIYWLNHLLSSTGAYEGAKLVRPGSFTTRACLGREVNDETGFERLIFDDCHWAAFNQVTLETAADLVSELQELCFSHFPLKFKSFLLGSVLKRSGQHFGEFVNKFHTYQTELNLENIVRVTRNCDTDDRLLMRWKNMNMPFRSATFPIDFTRMAYAHFVSMQVDPPLTRLANGVPEFEVFLLGYEENTCLIALEPALYDVEGSSGSIGI